MASILILFESKYGQSEQIARHIARTARERGLARTVRRVSAAGDGDVAWHDAVVVVAPVYFGRHPSATEAFLRAHAARLSALPTGFVSVSNRAARADPTSRAAASRLARAFIASVGVRARVVATAGGAVAYPRYGVFLRFVMRLIAKHTGGPTDVARIHELTDWHALNVALAPILDEVQALLPRIEPAGPDESGERPIPSPRAISAALD